MADKLASFGICRDSIYWWFVRWILETPFLDGNFHFLFKEFIVNFICHQTPLPNGKGTFSKCSV